MDELTLLLSDEKQVVLNSKLEAQKTNTSLSLKLKELRIFTTTLARLLGGGVPLLKALEVLEKQARTKPFQRFVSETLSSIREGESLSQVLFRYSRSFKGYYVQMIQAGEATGKLDQVFESLSSHLEKEESRNQKIKEAIAYPCFILLSGFVTLCVLIKGVLPKIMTVYDGLEGGLPLMTQWTLKLSEFFIPGVLIASVVAVAVVMVPGRKTSGLKTWALCVPGMKSIYFKNLLARFSSMLSLLLKSGVPILKSLEMLEASTSTVSEKKQLSQAKESIMCGSSVSSAFECIAWISTDVLTLVSAGEESGKLPECFEQIAAESNKDLESKIQMILKLLEPSLILGVGLIVSLIVMSALLPIFDMNQLLT